MLQGRGVSLVLVFALLCVGSAGARTPKKLPVLNVVPVAAPGAVTKTVGAGGGSLQVTTPNGTRVTLSIPSGALARDTQITVTPLSAVKRLPLKKGLAGAVQLAPEGLALAKPATLTFAPRKSVPLKFRTPFAASGTGSSFHVYPALNRSRLSLPLFHFSVYGEGEAPASQRAAEAVRQQSSPEATAERDLASDDSVNELASSFVAWADRLVPELQAAAAGSHVLDALDHGLSFAEALRLYGFGTEVLPAFGNAIPTNVRPTLRAQLETRLQRIRALFPAKILDNALLREENACVFQHEPTLADAIVAIQEYRRLFGLTDQIDLAPAEKCLTFELDVDTAFYTVGQRLTQGAHAKAKVALHVSSDLDLSHFHGSGDLTYVDVKEPVEASCSYTWNAKGTVYVLDMQVTLGRVDREFHIVEPLRVASVQMTPAGSENYEIRCPQADTVDTESVVIDQEWQDAHRAEGSAFSKIEDWSSGSGDVVGAKTYNRSFQNGGVTWNEATTLTIRHTPQS